MTKAGFYFLPLEVASSDGRNFTLLKPFTYVAKNGELITVPSGTESDGASTPRELWLTIPPFGVYWPAAFLHDYLYRDTKRPKAECDDLLREAMETLGVPVVERLAIYEGVKLGGAHAFNADRAAQTA